MGNLEVEKMEILGIEITPIIIVAIALVVIFFIVGLIKKVLWAWGVALFIVLALGVTQPDVVDGVKDAVVGFFGGASNPLSNEDYSDVADELEGELDIKDDINDFHYQHDKK